MITHHSLQLVQKVGHRSDSNHPMISTRTAGVVIDKFCLPCFKYFRALSLWGHRNNTPAALVLRTGWSGYGDGRRVETEPNWFEIRSLLKADLQLTQDAGWMIV